jgi:hypothetical protein
LNATAIYGQTAASLALGAGLSFLPIPHRRLAGVIAAAVAAPTLGPALYGLIGPASFTLTQVALLQLFAPDVVVARGRKASLALFTVFALIFYPLALGIGSFDPFDLGYRPTPVLLFMIPVGVLLAWRGEHVLLAIIGFDVLVYGFGLFANLWSALFDPIVVVLAAVRLIRPRESGGVGTRSSLPRASADSITEQV